MYELSVGSKIFVLGEYQVLESGTALLSVIEPRFKMKFIPGSGKVSGFHDKSPAGIFFNQHHEFFKNWDIEFVDPHDGAGGFGASTAQVALLQGFKTSYPSLEKDAWVELDLKGLHKNYLEMAQLSSGVQPSGADFVAQIQGGLVSVDLKHGKIQKTFWPFSKWQFLFFMTRNKVSTHDHLSKLTQLNTKKLNEIYQRSIRALEEQNEICFLQSFKDYQLELKALGWESEKTTQLLLKAQNYKGVLAAKGCGAMGSDVLALLIEKSNTIDIIKQMEKLGVKYCGGFDDQTEGLVSKYGP